MRKSVYIVLFLLISFASVVQIAAREYFPENIEDLKKRQAFVYATDENLRDFGPLALAQGGYCEGVVIKTGLVATVKHIQDEKKSLVWVNTYTAGTIRFSKEADIMLCRINTPECGIIQADTNPKPDMPVYVLTNLGAKFIWSEVGKIEKTGKIDKISKEVIFVKGYIPVEGDSGKPVFSKRGEFLGIVHGFAIDKKTKKKTGSAIIIPAKLILEFTEKEKF